MLERLLFVSKARLSAMEARSEVVRIADHARAANAERDVTGGMIYTGRYFAVLIEGPAAALDGLMARIGADQRHEAVSVLARGPAAARQFHGMHMAYSGLSSYLDRQIAPFFTGEFAKLTRAEALARLDALVNRFIEVRDSGSGRKSGSEPTLGKSPD